MVMRDRSVYLLKEIYRDARASVDAIALLIPKTSDSVFRSVLERQQTVYLDIANDAAMQLMGYRELPEETGFMERLGTWTALQMSTVTGKRPERIAETFINAGTAAIVDITRLLNSEPHVSEYARGLARQLLECERENIALMESWL